MWKVTLFSDSKSEFLHCFLHGKNAQVTLEEKPHENKLFEKYGYLMHTRSDKAVVGTVVNRALPSLHKGSLEITLTVPLKWHEINII